MSFTLLTCLNAVAFVCMYLYFARRIEKTFTEQKLLDALQRQAAGIVKEMLQDLNRVANRNITLMEEKIEEVRKILDVADKRILLIKNHSQKEDAAEKLEERLRKAQPLLEFPGKTETGEGEEKELSASGGDIMDLYRKGISPELIAKQLDVPVGEVELIISLRGARSADVGRKPRRH